MDVIALPPGELFLKINNSVVILLSYGTARVLLARRRGQEGGIHGRKFLH